MSHNPNQITFARIETRGGNTTERGFAFYNDREGRQVFVHITRCREVIGQGEDLSFGNRVEAGYFPGQIVLRVGPGKQSGQHAAVEWGADPEPHLKRHRPAWHTVYPFGDNTASYIGGRVEIFDTSRGYRMIEGRRTLRSLEIVGDDAVLRFSDGTVVRGKWWEFEVPSKGGRYGRAKLKLYGAIWRDLVLYPASEG